MRRIKLARKLWAIIGLLYIVENTYFGWNLDPQSELEFITDKIIIVSLLFTACIYLSPVLGIYEKLVEMTDKE